jgi:hypothetical protein
MQNPKLRRIRQAAANARWSHRPEPAEPREPVTDCRQPIDLDLSSVGGKRWTLVPRDGYHSWWLVDENGMRMKKAALKTLLRGLADDLPKMMSIRAL